VICEKPSAARKIASALANGKFRSHTVNRIEILQVNDGLKRYVICSALGHLYTVADTGRNRSVYPVFDVAWRPKDEVDRRSIHLRDRIKIIEELSTYADEFIIACDFDQEGETIGYNVLKYATKVKVVNPLRVKFSTLTGDEIRDAFRKAKPGLGGMMAEAGRARHVVDFLYGINLSRALSRAFLSARKGYRTISIGRVQGPTLAFLVKREIEVRSHVPTPYWRVSAILQKKGQKELIGNYERSRIHSRQEAEGVLEDCKSEQAEVVKITRSTLQQPSPTPFNTGDLQKEAFRVFRFTPSQTLYLAERLYLDGLISYPRTSSQKIPSSINYRAIIERLSRVYSFEDSATELLRGKRNLIPHQGWLDDPAHPAIYPTGETPRRKLDMGLFRLYDLIVRRFFSLFGEDVLRERIEVRIMISQHRFGFFGINLLKEGWLKYYTKYRSKGEKRIPELTVGDFLRVKRVEMSEELENSPQRYNHGSLLEKLEHEGIGTKATRAGIIKTIVDRGYTEPVSSRMTLEASELAFSLVEALEQHAPIILSPRMTKNLENYLENLGKGNTDARSVAGDAMEHLIVVLRSIRGSEGEIGSLLARSPASRNILEKLGQCPVCGKGELVIWVSRTTRKRSVICDNYPKANCAASAPLPQKGFIRPTAASCDSCKWPIVSTRFRGRPWKFCINVNCPKKEKRVQKSRLDGR
jgi:DNA topoisomerase-1